ncbi:diaminopimelate epimerase [Bacillus thuringiensis]|uniref:Diaminopimelate epimerase n=1 Tax=Bacillus thuringiensis TaxID=1428 RepID=A0A9X6WNK7_BACTU|nr:diaminopimelate epimerase [Bacillus thuringiensis]PFJ38828.1 diaminopimelate epimerase [Bacillus thuringiensis]
MKKIPYTKMHGLGNSYIYVNMFEENIDENLLSELAIEVSNANTGIGSDGLILICPSNNAAVKMRIFNNDGSEAKNCGNGLRCVAKYAYENKIVTVTEFTIETISGIVHAKVHIKDNIINEVTINMGFPKLRRKEIPMIGEGLDTVISETFNIENKTMYVTGVSMGNPHAVFFIDNINTAPLHTLGPSIEKDIRFPEGVNVEFVEVINNKEMHFRVWERGSGITQACGTGACAATVASILNGHMNKDEGITVHLAGGDLCITWNSNNEVLMKGPAETITKGIYYFKSN